MNSYTVTLGDDSTAEVTSVFDVTITGDGCASFFDNDGKLVAYFGYVRKVVRK